MGTKRHQGGKKERRRVRQKRVVRESWQVMCAEAAAGGYLNHVEEEVWVVGQHELFERLRPFRDRQGTQGGPRTGERETTAERKRERGGGLRATLEEGLRSRGEIARHGLCGPARAGGGSREARSGTR